MNKTTLKSIKNCDLDESALKYEQFRILGDINIGVSSESPEITNIFDIELMASKYI